VIAPAYHRIETLRARFLAEPMPMMRASAVDALVELDDDGLALFLLAAIEGARACAQADALEGLSRLPDPMIIDDVRPFLDDPHPNLRRLALVTLWQFPDGRRALMPTVHDLFPSMREDDYRHLPLPTRASYLFGIRAVGDIRLETAIPALRQGLAWEDGTVRLECACSLLHLDREDGVEEIRVRLEDGDEEARRRVEHLPIDTRAFFR
jgi:HEAT repeat protein